MREETIKAVAAETERCISIVRASCDELIADKIVEVIDSRHVTPCARCLADKGRVGPSHYGSPYSHARGAIAAGGEVAHCTCQGGY